MTGKEVDVVLYSDGGGDRQGTAAAACIVKENASARHLNLVAFLGGATNNEAEISAGLQGFSFLQLIAKAGLLSGRRLLWVCDSEYVLKSATAYIFNWQKNGWKTAGRKPVKNQGLWKAYLALSQGFEITPEHVYGHTGHPENEACDSAATWTRNNGEEFLRTRGAGASVTIPETNLKDPWIVLDLREVLENLRQDNPSLEELRLLTDQLAELGFAALPVPVEAQENNGCRSDLSVTDKDLQQLGSLLKQAKILADKIDSPLAGRLAALFDEFIELKQ